MLVYNKDTLISDDVLLILLRKKDLKPNSACGSSAHGNSSESPMGTDSSDKYCYEPALPVYG